MAPVAPRVIVKTHAEADPVSAAVPVGALVTAGEVKVRAPAPVSAQPAPVSEMMILPSLGTCVTGVRVTLMITAVALFKTLLSVISGLVVPRVS